MCEVAHRCSTAHYVPRHGHGLVDAYLCSVLSIRCVAEREEGR